MKAISLNCIYYLSRANGILTAVKDVAVDKGCDCSSVCRSGEGADLNGVLHVHPAAALEGGVALVAVAVLAVQALAVLPALHSSAVALAVVLAAGGFLAGAPAGGHVGGHAVEVSGVAVVGHLLRVEDELAVAGVVVAAGADAVAVADSPLREALAVELKAVDLGALAAGVLALLRPVGLPLALPSHCHGAVGRVPPALALVQQLLEEVLGRPSGQAVLVDESEGGAGEGRSAALLLVVRFKHEAIKNIEEVLRGGKRAEII
jgi:hypothetical protein